MEDDAQVVRARRVVLGGDDVVRRGPGPNTIHAVQSDASETMGWLGVVSVVLACVAVVCFIAMLVVAIRWSPSRR